MKKKVTLIVVAILLVISLVVGISYAYWRLMFTQTTSNKIATSCFSMELANEKNDITLESAYPISDEKGKALTPYSFTITNTCDLFASYTINLEMLEGTTLNSKYIKTMINNEAITNLNTLETTNTSIEGATESRILFKGSLGSGDSTDYTFRLWMDSETPATDESMNKVFQAKISIIAEVSSYSPVENGFNKLAEALLVNEYQTTSLSVAKDKIASKQSVDFSKTAPKIDWLEKHTTDVYSQTFSKAHPNTIGTYGVEENATKVLMGKKYSYNTETGYYKLEDTAYYDPTTLDYTKENYYYCNSSITLSANDTITYWDAKNCTTLLKIKESSYIDSTSTFDSGNKLNTRKYTFKVNYLISEQKESDKSDKGLYESTDNYGNTYYYRGNVANNNVEFAGFYWKVVRINGDGSVRLIYNGYNTNQNGEDKSIGLDIFNSQRADPTYVGYMYSDHVNISYESTIKNDQDSHMKQKLDKWYKANILDKGFSSYIADSGFCNDRSLKSGDGYLNTNGSVYAAEKRVYDATPTLICPNASNDLFTLQTSEKGNKALTYPIGLITVDEVMMAGVKNGYLNPLTYITYEYNYWTMSPLVYEKGSTCARVWVASNNGKLDYGTVTSTSRVRPVINLKGNTEITGGIGTKNDPFIVK